MGVTTEEVLRGGGFMFDEATHRYTRLDGLVVPSTTQILKRSGWVNYDQVQEYLLERKGKIGTAVHEITQFCDEQLADVPMEEIDLAPVAEDHRGYVQGWLRFKRECDVKIELCERQRITEINGMPYGMKYDILGRVNGRHAVVEKKTTSQWAKWWGLQLSSYDLGEGPVEGQLHRDRLAVQLRPDGTYRVYTFDDESDYSAFEWALATTWSQLNRGYKID